MTAPKKRLPKPLATLKLPGSNGYTLEVNDHSETVASVVIVGTATGKRHANVTLEWSDLEELHDWIGRLL